MINYWEFMETLIDGVNQDIIEVAYDDLTGVAETETINEVLLVRKVLSVLFTEFEGVLRDDHVTTCECLTPLELKDVDRGYCPTCMRRLNLIMWRLPVERSV